jgi:hypothetical protein
VLELDWSSAPGPVKLAFAVAPPMASAAPPARDGVEAIASVPDATSLHALAEQVRVGYPRGIHRWLDHIDATEPACVDFTQRLRALASRFQLDAMAVDIAQALLLREVPRG